MSLHSRSLVEFGQLLNRLTEILGEGGPVATALALVRDHFGASAVVMSIDSPGKPPVFHADDACAAPGGGDGNADFRALVDGLCERYLHIVASEFGEAGRSTFTMWVFREHGSPRLDNEEVASAGVLLAQIARTFDLAVRLDTNMVEKTLYSDILDRLNIGVVLLDAQGRVDRASEVARRFLQARDGLQIHGGRLRAVSASEDRALQVAIRVVEEAASGEPVSRGVSLTRQTGLRSLGVMVRPVPPSAGGSARLAVYIRDCETVPEVESEFVRQIFDLTPAEAAVTNRLTAGLSLEDAAVSLQISRNTARAHLRSIFSKSGITRQTELVRLVLSSAVMLGERPSQAA